jgi:hypothetical protein
MISKGWHWIKQAPELGVLLVMALITGLLALWLGTGFVIPDERIRIYLGVRYAVPVALAAICFAIPLLVRRGQGYDVPSMTRQLSWSAAFVAIFTLVMWLHFHIKMWIPLINPRRYDQLYQDIDLALSPLVDGLISIRAWVASVWPDNAWVPGIDWWYMIVFMGLFFVSFAYHLIADQSGFRRVYLATLINQSLGAVSYLVMPAIGPFLYDKGASLHATQSQTGMWDAYNALLKGGLPWLEAIGPSYFNAGLAAMPSLHAGASWVFVWYAFAHGTKLKELYVLAFAWIVIEAVATKWHYLIDLPVGVAVAGLSIWMANRLLEKQSD